jgi:8-oxo-dGTP pyrophosphatase MutT (NUDIX family)
LNAVAPLRGDDAVAALLVLDDGRYVVQLRDPIPQIFYPDHWGCFGGAVNPGEAPLDALRRELVEELEFEAGEAKEFTRFDFDFGMIAPGQKRAYRIYYEIRVARPAFDRFVLHEGARFDAFTGAHLLGALRVVPYDGFAVWLHLHRDRFR